MWLLWTALAGLALLVVLGYREKKHKRGGVYTQPGLCYELKRALAWAHFKFVRLRRVPRVQGHVDTRPSDYVTNGFVPAPEDEQAEQLRPLESAEASVEGGDALKPAGEASVQDGDALKPAGEASVEGEDVLKPAGEASVEGGDALKPAGEASVEGGDALKPAGEASVQDGNALKPAGEASVEGEDALTPAGEASVEGGDALKPAGEASVGGGDADVADRWVEAPTAGQAADDAEIGL
ncbi:paternally-expressed gene 3 protein-like [Pollicipes pollicipes]|uniref:paternally-expressed gene 3 protein-like n=1 Tax=Pollicipes pollicipes TaxID=41117 RepID=UPI0018851DEB|nr:paternally-expressed gene 3 protein-like [Pollicipes pollicipes]